MTNQCAKGHAKTDDNIRHRTGARSGHRECLVCYQEDHAKRDRRGMTWTPDQNRVRNLRKRSARLGLAMEKAGDEVAMIDAAGDKVFEGCIDDGEAWVAARFRAAPPGPDPQKMPPTWTPWVELFVAEQLAAKRRPGTLQTRTNHLLMFARARPHLTPLTITRDDLIGYMSGNDGWSPRTAHSFRSTFRVFFRLLYQLGHRDDDPAATLPAVIIPRSLPRPCPDHAVRHAYTAAANDDRLSLALKIAVETGVRPFEITTVRAEDVQGGPGVYGLRIVGKGGHERIVPISDALADEIVASGPGYAFRGRDGRPATRDWLAKCIATALPDQWTTYTLRHRFATLAYEGSRDIRAVQELLGHASPTTTAIYTKISDEAMRFAATAARLDPLGS